MDEQRNGRLGYGPEWDAAVEFGIDVSLIESNAQLTPAERIQELVAMNRLHEDIQARTLSVEERERLIAMELEEELARFWRCSTTAIARCARALQSMRSNLPPTRACASCANWRPARAGWCVSAPK